MSEIRYIYEAVAREPISLTIDGTEDDLAVYDMINYNMTPDVKEILIMGNVQEDKFVTIGGNVYNIEDTATEDDLVKREELKNIAIKKFNG